MTRQRTVWSLITVLTLTLYPAKAQENTKGHWGFQGDLARVNAPRFIVKIIDALPEKPDITGKSFSAGIVRFRADGAPRFALQYARMQVDLNGVLQEGLFRQAIAGSATLRGFMATKYINFVARKHVVGGLAVGGGVGKLDAAYVRTIRVTESPVTVKANTFRHTVPLFEILGRVEARPVRFISVGPYYGIRNGTLAFGLSLRIHAVR